MIKKIAIVVATIFSLIFIAFLALVVFAVCTASTSTGCGLASGRQIVASADAMYIGLESHQDTAIIRTMRRTITVAPTSLQVDGRTVATIAASTKLVSVTIEDGDISFVADGKPVKIRSQY